VGRQDRLSPLHVRIARENDRAVPHRRRHQGRLKDDHTRVDPVEGLARPELDAGRHLIVAAPRRVQLPPHVAEFLD
jgi:hypothetical protein